MIRNDDGRCICCDHAESCPVHMEYPADATCMCARGRAALDREEE